jgi:uncharacterized Zn-binding protein involved in type VI secretion
MRPIICLSDKTSTGGKVLQGSPLMKIKGKPVALVGMQATCNACKKGIGTLVAAGPRLGKVNNIDIVLAGDYVACGCPPFSNIVIPSQQIGTIE